MAATAPPQGAGAAPLPQAPHSNSTFHAAPPLYDLFMDLPHPAAASQCRPPFILPSPSSNPEIEKELNSNLSRIGRFAFPEFDDAIASSIPRDCPLNRYSQYAMQPKTFQHYAFSLQLQSGVRVHGHVRRYLPIHEVAKIRYDVGRRGERALVILTRASGGDLVYSAILKSIDAITFQKLALEEKRQPHREPEKWFLHKLYDAHKQLCAKFSTIPQQERKPMVLSLPFVEIGEKPIPLLDQVETTRFLIPTSLLSPTAHAVESVASSSILPLLRVLGVENTLRLLSALLSEGRVLLISSSPTRLAQCCRSALSILAQGLLNWQHIYIPVLPPHLFQYLAAPVPYLVGMLKSFAPRLDQMQGLGEMVIINLDTNQMETRGMNPTEVGQKIPDLFRTAMSEQGLPAASMSASEMLAQDLVDLLKIDKRTLHGESALTNVSETAAKASKAVKSGILKLKEKSKKFLNKRSSSISNAGSDEDDEDGVDPGADPDTLPCNTNLPDFIYTQGSQNEVAEEEARIAFASFFLSMFGNMRWYLSATPGKLPQLDRNRFLQQKRAMGEGENTPIWPLLQNFCHTQMLEEFAKARVEEVRTRWPVTSDCPLFTQCVNYLRMHNVDFSVMNVRRVTRQVAQGNPARLILQTQARRQAMLLTSNKTYDGDYNKAVASLVEQCREGSSVLFDVMSVIWVRLRDSKGLHWKHGFQALQILRNLLYHGPLAAIAEATDGLDKIRVMKFYNENMRSQICTQMRQVANQVYNLLVDRAKLFNIRRLCVHKRRMLRKPDQGRFNRDGRMRVTTPFSKMHVAFSPKKHSELRRASMSGVSATPQFAAEQDLLGFAADTAQATTFADPFAPAHSAPAQSSGNASDLVGAFQAVAVSTAPTQSPALNPFATAPPDPFAPSIPPEPPKPAAPADHFAAPSYPPSTQQMPQQRASYTPQQPPVASQPVPQQATYPPTNPGAVHGYAPGQPYPPPQPSTQNQPQQQYQQGYPVNSQSQVPAFHQTGYAPSPHYQNNVPPQYQQNAQPQQYLQPHQMAPPQQQPYQHQGYPPQSQGAQTPAPQKSDLSQFDPFK